MKLKLIMSIVVVGVVSGSVLGMEGSYWTWDAASEVSGMSGSSAWSTAVVPSAAASSLGSSSVVSDRFDGVVESDNRLYDFCRTEVAPRARMVVNRCINPCCTTNGREWTVQLVEGFLISALNYASGSPDSLRFIAMAQRGGLTVDVAATNLIIAMLMHCQQKDLVFMTLKAKQQIILDSALSGAEDFALNAGRIFDHLHHMQEHRVHACQPVIYPACGGSCTGAVSW